MNPRLERRTEAGERTQVDETPTDDHSPEPSTVRAQDRPHAEATRHRSRTGHASWHRWWPPIVLAALVMAVWGRLVVTRFDSARLSNPGDSISFQYYLGWNVHAVLHAENPFFTPNMYAPHGLDLGNAISIPTVSLLMAPVTLLAGPTAAYNVGFLLSIWLAAVSTYLLARQLSGNRVGACAAGALMVLNPYFTGHSLSHYNLMWIFALPLTAYLFARYVTGQLRGAWFAVGTGVLLAFTLGASTELALTETVFGAVALALTLILARAGVRLAVVRGAAWLIVGGVLGAVLATPVILAALHSGVPDAPANPPALYSSDLLNVVAPTRMFLIGGHETGPWTTDWLGNDGENTAYVPLVLMLLVAVLAVARRTRLTAGLLLFAAVSLVFSFGPALVIDGQPHGWLPWKLTAQLPALNHALPGRFSMFAFLALCLVVATCWPRSRSGALTAGVAVLVSATLLLPDFGFADIPTQTTDRSFITTGDYKKVIRPNQIALVLPGGQSGPGLEWVVDSDFYFRVPTGNGGGAVAPQSLKSPVGLALFQQNTAFDYRDTLKHWMRRRDVSVLLVPVAETYYSDLAHQILGQPFRVLDDVQVWHIPRGRTGTRR